MASALAEILQPHANDPNLGPAIAAALKMLKAAKIEEEDGPNPVADTSGYFARVHAFRKQAGHFKQLPVGFDETIEVLSRQDVPVRLASAQTSLGHIAVWLDHQNRPLGVHVFDQPSRAKPARGGED